MPFPNKKTILYPILFLSWLLIGTGCTDNTSKQPQSLLAAGSSSTTLLQADDLLHRRLQAVLDADNAFAQLTTGAAQTTAIDAQSEAIARAEMALQQTLDSLERTEAKAGTADGLHKTTGYFKNVLQSRGALSDLRMVLSANSDDSTAMQRHLAQLRSEVQEKNRRIAALEQAARSGNNRQPALVQNGNLAASAPAKGETPADLKQRNKNLALALNNMQVKYFVLGRDYLVLKKQHERTVAELAELRKGKNQN